MLLGSRSGLPAMVGCCAGVVVPPVVGAGRDTPADLSVTGASVWVSLLAQPAAMAAMARYRATFFMVSLLLLVLEQPCCGTLSSWASGPMQGPGRPRRWTSGAGALARPTRRRPGCPDRPP